jgi:uncharacterized membrane protein YgcG
MPTPPTPLADRDLVRWAPGDLRTRCPGYLVTRTPRALQRWGEFPQWTRSTRVLRVGALGVLGAILSAAATVPAPPREGHFFVDETGRLSNAVRAEIDALAASVEQGGYGHLQILVTNGAADADARAREVFDAWPAGHAERFDGALLMIAVQQRQASIVLGDGFGRFAKAAAPQVVKKWIAPQLSEGDVDAATATGARAMLDLLVRYHRPSQEPDSGEPPADDEEKPADALAPPTDADLSRSLIVPMMLIAPLGLLLLGGVLVYTFTRKR